MKLKLLDYLTMPLVELACHEDFNEDLFWIAIQVNDISMDEFAKRFEHAKSE